MRSTPLDQSNKPLLAIVGPTAVGKTALSLDIAGRFDGEVVSADSRQVYVGMDIGTAKPSLPERAATPHHLVDILNPDDTLTVAEFQRRAYHVIADIHSRAKLPILAGGTGQYVAAVLEGWSIPAVPPDPAIRAELEAVAAEQGGDVLYERLKEVDPAAAAAIDHRNIRRVIRALEVYRTTGRPISELQRRSPPPYRVMKLGLTMPREELYGRIDLRIDSMMQQGLLDEIKGLLSSGYSWDLPAMSALGYREFQAYLAGEISLEDAVALVKKDTRAFVRKQYNWFRLVDPSIHWLDARTLDPDAVADRIRSWLSAGT